MNQRMKIFLVGVLVITGLPQLRAAVAPLSPEALNKTASHVVRGTVMKKSSVKKKSKIETGFGVHRDHIITLTFKVEAVSKGKSIKTGDEITVEAWRPATRLPPLPGPQGHGSIPDKGDTVTIYLESKSGNSWKPILPNGFKPDTKNR